jgi:uncharacterized protein YndB with AHSA1/START domain
MPTQKVLRQSVSFAAPPETIYRALMDSKLHARFTGDKAKVSPKVGGAVSAFDGYISAFNVELVPNRRIVQAWRGSDWPDGAWSIASFELAPQAGGKTKLTFTHLGIPPKHFASISSGWQEHYWEPLKQLLAGEL